jgi:hypothetical protein
MPVLNVGKPNPGAKTLAAISNLFKEHGCL